MRCALPALLSLIVLNIPANSAANPDWFPKQQMTTIGVYYYPEAWPESQWARDMGNIRKLGMEYVHMGEFAWYFMEPEEGKYQFDWLEKSVELAASQGLKVVLCTPSATPPIWLTHEHPETLDGGPAGADDDPREPRTRRLEFAAIPRIREQNRYRIGQALRA